MIECGPYVISKDPIVPYGRDRNHTCSLCHVGSQLFTKQASNQGFQFRGLEFVEGLGLNICRCVDDRCLGEKLPSLAFIHFLAVSDYGARHI